MMLVRADITAPDFTTASSTAANATAAKVPTAYSAVVIPAVRSRPTRRPLAHIRDRNELRIDIPCPPKGVPTGTPAGRSGLWIDARVDRTCWPERFSRLWIVGRDAHTLCTPDAAANGTPEGRCRRTQRAVAVLLS